MSEFKKCVRCGFNDAGCCTCPPYDKWYACPIESEKPENIQALKDYANKLAAESERETVEKIYKYAAADMEALGIINKQKAESEVEK